MAMSTSYHDFSAGETSWCTAAKHLHVYEASEAGSSGEQLLL